MASIAVQIVTYNSADYIEDCLDSVIFQSYPVEKIIVIDNNSNDCIKDVVSHYSNVYFVQNSINSGFVGGHNQGLNYAETDYVLVLNPDVILDKYYIEYIIEFMKLNEKVGAATGKLYRDLESHIIDSTGINIKKNRRAVDRGSGEVDQGQYDDERSVFGVSGAAAVYKREMIDMISEDGQFFDESFFAYKEDVDVSWRARLAGWEICFVPKSIAKHERGWKDNKSRKNISLKTRKHSYINRHFYVIKNDNLFYFLLHFPFIFIYEVTCLVYIIFREPKLFSAYKLLFKEYKTLKKKKKFIQSCRIAPSKKIYQYFKGIW
ncbi:glycosyltransferase family 2 protein [Lysinibacillus pakistanensis]|uniref:Glycosyltransferase family 2 protein n=1 Tax=Lysinibacillus pakistanensis TaxID=759811 RepID=A0AAX3WWQ8_9BACI|nr:glycosyltransferase family 2 protein [Lysinibacillus pakistanensis]MDM5231766.1 glycosyltransferase family 2 protein [Lysinibacillus pakistanensis]WHY47304.1 glycosyltransferase family 2 protein [Lysinibacillus pakistanensis]WHY52313.1 glycosyltransferase family 2 protein [Lysinibacillus pakistanensis]